MGKAILIKPDGTFQMVEIVGSTLDWIEKTIGAKRVRVIPSDLLVYKQVLVYSAEDRGEDDACNFLASRLKENSLTDDGSFVHGDALVMDCQSLFAVLGSED